MVSKCPAHGDANQEGGKEAGLSITEGLFGGHLCAFGDRAAKAGPKRKGIPKGEADS